VNSVHKNLTRYSCDLCDYSSYHKSHLEAHSKAVHLGIKDFKCDICDKAFSGKGHLNDHVNCVHKNLTRYSCDLCDFSSYTKAVLERHLIGVHLKTYPDDEHFEEILETTEVEIKEEFVADPHHAYY
jgi:uncharacterized Zn-finger protein